MKTVLTIILAVAAAAPLRAQITEAPATIALNSGANPQGYIQGSRPGAVLFSTQEGVRGQWVPLSNIRGDGLDKLIRIQDRADQLAVGRAAFAEGDYATAAREFGKVADAYGILLYIPLNFASEARFFQIESLRRLGAFSAIAPLLETPAGKSMESMLSEQYQPFIAMHRLWAIYGSGDMAALEAALAPYQEPVAEKAKLLPAPNFKKMPPHELIQVAFMRAKLFESKDQKDKALEDYYRVFTMTFANEPFLSKQAMGAALVIKSQDPDLKSEDPLVKMRPLNEIQSVAYYFSKRFPETPMPPQFQEYAVRPNSEPIFPPSEEKDAAGEDTSAPEQPAAPGGKGKAGDTSGGDAPGKGQNPPKGKGSEPAKGKGKNDKGKGNAGKGNQPKP